MSVAASVFHQQPRTDVAIQVPWSRQLASRVLERQQYRRLVHAYEVARELGPKTVLIHGPTGLTWRVRVEKFDEGFDVTWNYID